MSVAAAARNEIDDRLEAWARWRRAATRPPTGGFGNPLAGLVAEGATLDRGTKGMQEAEAVAREMRAALDLRIAQAAAEVARLKCGSPRLGPVIDSMTDYLARLKRARSKIPITANGLAWASLIRGTGQRAEQEAPEEEAVESAVTALPPTLKRVVFAEYLQYGTQDMKAKWIGFSLATYKRRLAEALKTIEHELTR